LNRDLQFYGLLALSALALVMLILIGIVIAAVANHIGPDGKVPAAESFGFTALLLSFREIIGALKAIWAYEDRATMTGHLAESSPAQSAKE